VNDRSRPIGAAPESSARTTTEQSTYAAAAPALLATGLGSPLPLPYGQKSPPPTGWTGETAPYASAGDVGGWAAERPQANVALRLAPDVVGIDVDAYDGRPGVETIADFEAKFGPLPPTWVSSARPAPSGIRWYVLPEGETSAGMGDLGPGVELLRAGHRYACVPPSLHPLGVPVAWRNPDGTPSDTPPARRELAVLTGRQVQGLAAHRTSTPRRTTPSPAPASASSASPEVPEALRARVRDYARQAYAGLVADARALAALPEGERLPLAGELIGWESGLGKSLVLRACQFDAATWHSGPEGVFVAAVRGVSSDPAWTSLVDEKAAAKARIAEPAALPRFVTDYDPSDPFTAGSGGYAPPTSHATVATPLELNLPERRLVLAAADSIKPRPVFWLWDGRLALGSLGLLAGREGLGKSTLGYWAAARVTRGELPGQYWGTPRSVLVCATEDSWAHTIVPRLMAAGADLARVFRVEVLNALDIHVGLSLPRDLIALERAAGETDAALLLLDPLMSRLGDLDTHRDAEVRQALEPLVAIADRTGMAALGVMHHNKSGSADPLQVVMGSRAFTAVARSVHAVVPDPDDESDTRRLFGTPKNNLGRTNLPTLSFTIEGHPINTAEGTAWTGRLEWGEEMAGSIGDAMRRAADTPDDKSAASEAGDWLADHLASQGGTDDSASIKREGQKAGHSQDALKRARRRIEATLSSQGFPRRTYWTLAGTGSTPVGVASQSQSEHQSEQIPRGEYLTALTAPTGADQRSWCSRSSGSASPETSPPTGAPTSAATLSELPCTTCGVPVSAMRADFGKTTCVDCESAQADRPRSWSA